MKLEIQQTELLKHINIVQRAISQRSTMKILQGFLLIARENELILRATDLEVSIETRTKADIQEEGAIVLQSTLFGNIIRRLPQGLVRLTTKDLQLHLACGHAEFDLLGQDPMEYPELPEAQGEEGIQVLSDAFKNAVRRTEFAASLDESRPVFTGVLLDFHPEELRLVAMDGYRIALATIPVKGLQGKSLIVPARSLRELVKILGEEEEFTLRPLHHHVLFEVGDTLLFSKLLDGRFIDYEEILPKSHTTRIEADRRELLSALERASTLSRSDNANLITQNLKEGSMEIRSNAELGKVREEVFLEKEGPDLLIGFNAKYFMDGLRALDDERVSIDYKDRLDACLMHTDKEDYRYLLLPVKLSEKERELYD